MGLTSNKLKIVAIITMIIDHFGYYFYYLLSDNIYLLCRIIGRISMPIFVFLLIEGYVHTKNYKKYIGKISILAIITQIIIFLITYVNLKIYPNYKIEVGLSYNILFAFVFILLFLKILDKFLDKKSNVIQKVIFIIIMIVIGVLMTALKLDYKLITLLLALIFYITKILIENRVIRNILICILTLMLCLILEELNFYIILSIPFILLYNNKLGKKSNMIKNMYYCIFPIQHAFMYMIAIYVYYMK